MKVYYKTIRVALLSIILLTANVQAQDDSPGIEFESTRVIYPEQSKNGITFTVTNNSNDVYLLQSRVSPWGSETTNSIEENNSSPFIVIPPLVRFEPHSTVTLNIRMTKKISVKDRESVYKLALKTIPSQEKGESINNKPENEAKLVLALQNNFKMFYRPSNIQEIKYSDREKMLKVNKKGEELVLSNPTPYYLTFEKLMVGNQSLLESGSKMISPFSELRYHMNEPGSEVQWQIIRDDRR